jgi:hypothetical protein
MTNEETAVKATYFSHWKCLLSPYQGTAFFW